MNEAIEKVMMLKIGEKKLRIKSIYPFRYDYGKGKEVLRIEISAKDHTFAEILSLENNAEDMLYYEDGALVNTYKGYAADFSSQYTEEVYSIEITRCGALEVKVKDLEQQLTDAQLALAEMYEGREQ